MSGWKFHGKATAGHIKTAFKIGNRCKVNVSDRQYSHMKKGNVLAKYYVNKKTITYYKLLTLLQTYVLYHLGIHLIHHPQIYVCIQ